MAELFGLKIPFYLSFFIAVMTIPFSLVIPTVIHKEKTFEENVNCLENEHSSLLMPLRIVLFLFIVSNLINGLANGFASALINSLCNI